MKSAYDIISSIQNRPQFSKLSRYKCIDRICSSFSAPLQKMIKFTYIKNKTLFFVLNHPGAKQEFDNNIQSIKSALKYAKPKECQELEIEDMKAFVSHTPSVKKSHATLTQSIAHYKERAKGEFSITTKDEKLSKIFSTIQDIIKNRYDA